jgi:hypothetical protein
MYDLRNFIQAEMEFKQREASRPTAGSHREAVQSTIQEALEMLRNKRQRKNQK